MIKQLSIPYVPSQAVRAVAGLGLVLILTFAGSVSADDVVFGFVAGMGGVAPDSSYSIAVDSFGGVYTTGQFFGTVDFDPGAGTANLTSVGGGDIFVQKLDSDGNFLWAKSMGGTDHDLGEGITVDESGNVYTTGSFLDTVDFDPTSEGTANLTSLGSRDIFIQKLDSSGNFVWAKSMGGTSLDLHPHIALDTSGNVYTTGEFWHTADFDPGAGLHNLTSAGYADVFISKLDSFGNFVWAKSMGGTDLESGYDIVVDGSGNVYTLGIFQGTADFDPGEGTANRTSAGSNDIFVSKLDSFGNFVWAKAIGGANAEFGYGITVGSLGNVYTTGSFGGTVDFDPGEGTYNLIGGGEFVQKLNSAGNFVWAISVGSATGLGIAVDEPGNVYTVGIFRGTADFDPGAGTANHISAGINDIFVSKLDSAGNFIWAKSMGGTDFDEGWDIALDASGNVYITGNFAETVDFDPGAGVVNITSAGQRDIFVSKLAHVAYLPESWVDFGFVGVESGSYNNPFNRFTKGLAAVVEAGTVKIKGNTGDADSDETLTINQVVTIKAVDGTVRIGNSVGRSADNGQRSGFISRN